MAELKALKSTFMNLQKTESSFKLSERTVVDIINIIANRGKVKLLHTVTGKEYVVDEKVNLEILNEIKKNKIISILELSKSLEIPLNIIEKKVTQLLSKNMTLILVENKILTEDYLNKMVVEINLELKRKGSATIAELSNLFELSIDFITKFLKEKTGDDKQIKAKLYPTRILTDYYIEMQKKKIRPALISSVTPINISSLITKYDIDEMLINDVIDSMIVSGEIKGKFRANEYESNVYANSQNNYLKEELYLNNYIDYSKLKNIGITQNGKDYLKSLRKTDAIFEDGVFLNDYFISDILKSNFAFLFQENTEKAIPTNMATSFFFIVDYEDSQQLLESIHVPMDKYFFINNNLVPKSIVQLILEEYQPMIRELANQNYKQYVSKVRDKEKTIETASSSTNKKKGKKGKKTKESNVIEDTEQDINNIIQLPPDNEALIKTKLKANSKFDDINEKDETINVLFSKYILPKLNSLYSESVISLVKTKSNIAGDPASLMTQIDNEYIYMKVVQKQLELLIKTSNNDAFQSSMKAIFAFIAKTDLVSLLRDLMLYQLMHMKIKVDNPKLATHKERSDFINMYPDDDIRQVFIQLNDHIQNKQVNQFMNYLTDNGKILAVSLSPCSKTIEKTQIESIKGSLNESVNTQYKLLGSLSMKDYTTLIVDLCNLALSKKGYYLNLPNETWSISLYITIFSETVFNYEEAVKILTSINEILSSKTDDYLKKEKELISYATDLFNTL